MFYKAVIIKQNDYVEELNSKTVYKTKQTNMFYTTFTLEVAVYTEGATITLCSCLVLASYAVK